MKYFFVFKTHQAACGGATHEYRIGSKSIYLQRNLSQSVQYIRMYVEDQNRMLKSVGMDPWGQPHDRELQGQRC
jgi:hypothetical protein